MEFYGSLIMGVCDERKASFFPDKGWVWDMQAIDEFAARRQLEFYDRGSTKFINSVSEFWQACRWRRSNFVDSFYKCSRCIGFERFVWGSNSRKKEVYALYPEVEFGFAYFGMRLPRPGQREYSGLWDALEDKLGQEVVVVGLRDLLRGGF